MSARSIHRGRRFAAKPRQSLSPTRHDFELSPLENRLLLHAQGVFAQIAPQDHFLAYDAATAMSMPEASSTPATAEAGSVLKSPLSGMPLD